MDYYKVLELKRDSTDAEIKKAYRQLAIQWHPARAEGKDPDSVKEKFRDLSEAYCVLVNPKLRAIFDQYGAKGLKSGLPNGKGGYVGAWTYNVNPDEQFAEFFGSFSPFADYFNEDAGYAKLFNKGDGTSGQKMETQTVNLYCSLEELHSGCIKRQRVTRQKLGFDGRTTQPDTRIMTVEVKPGWREGTKITFTCDGDEAADMVTGDIVFVLREKPHPRFKRSKNDLSYTADVSLIEALTGVTLYIDTLDGRTLPISINDVIKPDSKKVVPTEGMPLVGKAGQRGNLVIEFNISFPDTLTEAQKTTLKNL